MTQLRVMCAISGALGSVALSGQSRIKFLFDDAGARPTCSKMCSSTGSRSRRPDFRASMSAPRPSRRSASTHVQGAR
jgi:hypothetical protein